MGILNAIFGPPETVEERNARWASLTPNRPLNPVDGKKVFKCFACGHIHIGSEGEFTSCRECYYPFTENPERLEGNGEFVKVLPCTPYGRGSYNVSKWVTYPVFERHENYIILLRKFLIGTYGKYPPMSSKCFMNVNEDGSFFNSCDEELYNLIDKYHIGGRFINRNGVVMDIKGVFHDEDKFMARCKVYHHPISQVCIGQTANTDIYELEAYEYKNIKEPEYLHGAKDILKKALHGEQ